MPAQQSTVCCDANIIVAWALQDPTRAGFRLVDDWLADGVELVAPALIYFEIANAIYRDNRATKGDPDEVNSLIRLIYRLPIHLVIDQQLSLDALAIADRFNLPAAYDARYLALASRENCELWTADKRLFNAVQRHLPFVRYIDRTNVER